MKKLILIYKEMKTLVLNHKLYFLVPLVICIAAVAFLFVTLGSNIVMTFIYAGV